MVKLSEQLAIQDQRDVRLSRSERVREKQAQQRFLLEEAKEKSEFERKQKIAEELQKTNFANIQDLKEYGEKYQQLDPEIKPFFSTPETVKQTQTERIDDNKLKVKEKLTFANEEIKRATEIRDARYKKNQTTFDNSTSAGRQETKIKQDLSAEKEFELRAAYLRGYKEGLGKGLGELNQDKDISLSDIESHASQIGYFEKAKERASIEESDFQRSKAQEIKELQEQGYKPFIIERSFKGKTEEAYLTFLKDGEFKQVATFQAPKQISTKGLQLSKLGRVEVERSLFFVGKEFKFKSRLQLYIDPSGRLKTRYGYIGKSEKEIIKDAQDQAFQDFQKTQQPTIVFGTPEQYGRDYHKATGSNSFTIAIPMGRENGKIRVQDYNFRFENDVLVKAKPTGTALITEKQYIAADKRRREKYPSFTYGSLTKFYDLDFKVIQKKDLPSGFGGQQTISDQRTIQLITKEQYYAQKDQPSFLSKITKPSVNLYGKIPSGRFYYNPKLFGIGSGLSTFKTSKRSIDITAKIEKGSERLGDISADIKQWAFGKKGREKLSKLDLELETKYQEKYQATFERKYMKSLIYEDVTFEEATKKFETSKEAKLLQREYQEEYGVSYKQISSDVPILRAGTGGLAMAGVSLGQLGLKAIRTPKAAATSTVLVYTGLKTLKAIPTGVSYTASGGLAIYGTYKFVSPTSTIEERGAGLLTAGISAGFLGYGAYRHFKSPVIKTVKIKPKLSAKIQKVVAFETRPVVKTDVFGKVTRIEKTIVPKTLSRQVIEGRKTIVTTKGRVFLAKYTKIKLDPIYKGLPTQQPIEYKKALSKLTKYGYTPSQARATLRYTAPKVIDTELKSINVLYSGSAIKTPFAKTKTEVITRQPKIEFGARLKTRGARTIKDIYRSEKVIVGSFKDKVIIKEALIRTRSPALLGKTTVQFERTILAKAGVVKKGRVIVGGGRDIKLLISKEYRYQNLKEVFRQRQIVPKQLRELYGGQKTKLIKTKKDPFFIDERELTGIRARETFTPTKPAKVKTIAEMSNKELKEMIRDLQKIYGTGKPLPKLKLPKRIVKPSVIIDQVDDAAISTSRDQVSKYYGTGQYERTAGGISPQELKGLDFPQVKTPDINLQTQIREISKLDKLLKVNVASLVGIRSLTGLKTKTDLKSDLKLKTDLKNILKTDLVLKTKQEAALKQAPSLKTLLKTRLDVQQVSLSLLTPAITIPKIPVITPPTFTPKPFFIPILKAKIKKKGKKKTKKIQEFAFFPDFTAKALGLKPEILTGKQAQARVRKILTGLEIRRPIKIK